MVFTSSRIRTPIPQKVGRLSCSFLINLGCLPVTLVLKALTSRPFQLSAAAILAVLGLNEAGFFDRKDGQHPITKWIKSQHPTDEELLRSRLLALHRAAKVSSHNRTTATARRPGYQRVRNTAYVFISRTSSLSRSNSWFCLGCSHMEARTTSRWARHQSSTIQKSSQTMRRGSSMFQTIGSFLYIISTINSGL